MLTNVWKIIGTAPRDGSRFLAFDPSLEMPYFVCAWWSGDSVTSEGFFRIDLFLHIDNEWDYEPTHWLELPNPPKTNKNQGGLE